MALASRKVTVLATLRDRQGSSQGWALEELCEKTTLSESEVLEVLALYAGPLGFIGADRTKGKENTYWINHAGVEALALAEEYMREWV